MRFGFALVFCWDVSGMAELKSATSLVEETLDSGTTFTVSDLINREYASYIHCRYSAGFSFDKKRIKDLRPLSTPSNELIKASSYRINGP